MKIDKIALIEISDLVYPDRRYSGLGMGYLKSFLHKQIKGIDIKIIQDDLFNKIIKFNPDLICISSVSYFYEDAISFVKLLKQYLPKTIFFIGGNHITVCPDAFNKVFDIGIIGEGEYTIFELVELFKNNKHQIFNLKKIKGIVYIDNNKIKINKRRHLIRDIDQIPNIDRNDFQHDHYNYILTSRGCFFDCAYCGSKAFWGNTQVRFHSPEYVVKEMKALEKNIINEICIYDESFAIDKNRLKKIVSLWRVSKNLFKSTSFICFIKPQCLTNDICELLKKLNVKKVGMYIDSGNSLVLKNNKTMLLQNNIAINILMSWGIEVIATLTVNNLNESKKSYLETQAFVETHKKVKFFISTNPPFPGTKYFNNYCKRRKNKSFSDFKNMRFKSFELLSYYNNNLTLSRSNFREMLFFVNKIQQHIKKNHKYIFIKVLCKKIIKTISKLNLIKLKNRIKSICYKLGLVKIRYFPREISFRITNKCNLNCIMCLNANYRNKHLKEADFNYELAQKIVPELAINKVRIYLSGGEPLLNRELFKIIELFRSNNLYVYIYTNGYLLEKYAKELIASDINQITISIDHHNREVHDKIRGVSGSFDKAMRGIEKLKRLKSNIEINISTVILKENYFDLANMYDYFESIGGINNWFLQKTSFLNNKISQSLKNKTDLYEEKAKYKDGILINEVEFFNPREIDSLKKQLAVINMKSFFYKTKIKRNFPKNMDISSYYSGKFPKNKSKCMGVFDEIHILNSKVCTWCGYEIGDLKSTQSLLEIWNGKANRDFQKHILEKKTISNCFRCTRMDFKF